MTEYIGLIVTLFLLSMISERVADFLKNFLSEGSSGIGFYIRKWLHIGNLLTKEDPGSLEEQRRGYRILKLNMVCGLIVAWAFHADLFEIARQKDHALNTIGWSNVTMVPITDWLDGDNLLNGLTFVLGCMATGFFISFGSKFWHDLLDIVYQSKNYKRILADPDTYKIDNISSLDQAISTYPSSYINDAFNTAKQKYMAMPNVKVVSLKQDDNGYYFEVAAQGPTTSIANNYQYYFNGRQVSIPVKVVTLSPDQTAALHLDLGDQVFDQNHTADYGTMGCLVKEAGSTNSNRYLMTCSHNVIPPPATGFQSGSITAGSNKLATLGPVTQAVFTTEVDGATISLAPEVFSQINNNVPQRGTPQKAVDLDNTAIGKQSVFVYGAKTRKSISGKVTSVFASVKVGYKDQEFELHNVIIAADGASPISQAGDSGAVVLDQNNNVIGLIVAGMYNQSFILPINTLLITLNMELI